MKANIIFSVLILASLSSCDVLDVKPQSAIDASIALSDKEGIEKAVLGTYSSLQSLSYFGRTHILFQDLAADNLIHPIDATSSDYAQVANNNILPDNGSIDGLWSSLYDGINRANNVIENVVKVEDMTTEEKDAVIAEMRFIRALNHFNLTNYYGDVPLKVKATSGIEGLNTPRIAKAEIYKQVIEDLLFAEQHLAASASTKIRATKFGATALLARVYLYSGAYALAKTKATEVIDKGGYTFLPSYGSIFGGDGSAETIFEIDFTELDKNRIAEYNFPKTLNGRREVAPSPSLLSAYEVGDKRKDVSIGIDGTNAYAVKYEDLSTGADNVIVIRLAEMYLIRAEAEANLQGNILAIQKDIDKIRNRANLSGTSASTYTALLNSIDKERRIEFAFEGFRWFDLIRTGRAVDELPNVTSVNQTLFPIPLDEILTNKDSGMKQNPGY